MLSRPKRAAFNGSQTRRLIGDVAACVGGFWSRFARVKEFPACDRHIPFGSEGHLWAIAVFLAVVGALFQNTIRGDDAVDLQMRLCQKQDLEIVATIQRDLGVMSHAHRTESEGIEADA